MTETEYFRMLFVKYLTEDSETHDMWRKDFNQAIFDKEDGWACDMYTDLSMVLEKFDMAIKELKRENKRFYPMKKQDEQKADFGLKQFGIKPWVYHFRTGVAPFTAITIVDNVRSWITTKFILDNIVSAIDWDTELFYFSTARYFEEMLHKNYIYGFALCSRDGYFDRQRGRTIAKGRLLKYLKEIGK